MKDLMQQISVASAGKEAGFRCVPDNVDLLSSVRMDGESHVAKTTGKRVNAGHTLERRKNGRIHHRIAATFDNFRAGNRTVFEDFDFDGADERFVLLKNGCRLLPLAEEPVMDQLVIPAKLPSGTCSTFARASGSASSSALT
jgi:hypothetical protein